MRILREDQGPGVPMVALFPGADVIHRHALHTPGEFSPLEVHAYDGELLASLELAPYAGLVRWIAPASDRLVSDVTRYHAGPTGECMCWEALLQWDLTTVAP